MFKLPPKLVSQSIYIKKGKRQMNLLGVEEIVLASFWYSKNIIKTRTGTMLAPLVFSFDYYKILPFLDIPVDVRSSSAGYCKRS